MAAREATSPAAIRPTAVAITIEKSISEPGSAKSNARAKAVAPIGRPTARIKPRTPRRMEFGKNVSRMESSRYRVYRSCVTTSRGLGELDDLPQASSTIRRRVAREHLPCEARHAGYDAYGGERGMDTLIVIVVSLVLVGTAGCLVVAMVRSIVNERRSSGVKRVWKNFGLSLAFCLLFLISWLGHGLAEWETYRGEQHAHREAATATGYIVHFGRSTLENWQSEFLQLFSFVVFSAVLIHRGSAESKDSEERIEAMVREIKQRLDGIDHDRS